MYTYVILLLWYLLLGRPVHVLSSIKTTLLLYSLDDDDLSCFSVVLLLFFVHARRWLSNFSFYRAALNARESSSVCLSVCPSVERRVHCDKTEERSVQIFTPYERSFSLVFGEEEWLVGQHLLCEILGQPTPFGAKSPILNR